jgi:hypothetical protein
MARIAALCLDPDQRENHFSFDAFFTHVLVSV